jgi:AmmeMemoRadiSam system protein B
MSPLRRHRGPVRKPAVAGTFYPADPDELAAVVDAAVSRARTEREPSTRPKALIAPHAGYQFSGPIAASAYACLVDADPPVERVVLLGPAHRVALSGLALPSVESFATPLGLVPVDTAGRERLAEHPAVVVDDRPHAGEHALEVHLPFLQRVLTEPWSLLPIVVGDARPVDVAEVLDLGWGGDETIVVASTDLSHYLEHQAARAVDRDTAHLIVARDVDALDPSRACGARAVAGVLEAACRHDLGVRLLDLRTSGDTAGPRDRVVGYGAFAVA